MEVIFQPISSHRWIVDKRVMPPNKSDSFRFVEPTIETSKMPLFEYVECVDDFVVVAVV